MPERTCPYLGFADDNTTATAYPDNRNVCHRAKPSCAVAMQHQANRCLQDTHRECPGFRYGWEKGLPKELCPEQHKGTKFDISKVWMFVVGAGIFLVAAGFFIGALQMGPAPVATIPGGFNPYTTTPFALYKPTETMTLMPTLTATPVPTDTPESEEVLSVTETPILPEVTPLPGLQTPFVRGEDELVIVLVEEGQTLDDIADIYDTNSEVLVALNDLNADPNVGDALVVIVGQQSVDDLPVLSAYYVETDMMLEDLAAACGCTLEDLQVWNNFGDVDWVNGGSWVVVEIRSEE